MSTFLSPEELAVCNKHNVNLKDNFIIIRDKHTGEVLSAANNLVLHKGRTLALRKLFNVLPAGVNQDTFNQRSVCLFGIGSGGTPVSNPFQPTPPTSLDSDLNTKIALRVVDSSRGDRLDTEEQSLYTDGVTEGSAQKFYKKTFNSIELVSNPDQDEVYVKIGLEISEKDARGALVSELAIYSAKKAANVYTDYEIFSRITFQTESLNESTNKALLINYYVYC